MEYTAQSSLCTIFTSNCSNAGVEWLRNFNCEGNDSTSAVDTAAETFVTAGLSKVLKINNICDNEHLQDCGITSKITTLGGVIISTPKNMLELNSYLTLSISDGAGGATSMVNSKAAAFETQNGENVLIYYNPNCMGSLKETPWGGTAGYFIQNKVCINFIYDFNGLKGPNTVGKDIGFMTVMYPSDPVLAAPSPASKPLSEQIEGNLAARACTDFDNQYRLPNVSEIISMFVNMNLLQGSSSAFSGDLYWSSEKIFFNNEIRLLVMNVRDSNKMGQIDDIAMGYARGVWCVKR